VVLGGETRSRSSSMIPHFSKNGKVCSLIAAAWIRSEGPSLERCEYHFASNCDFSVPRSTKIAMYGTSVVQSIDASSRRMKGKVDALWVLVALSDMKI